MGSAHSSYNAAATAITPAGVPSLSPVWRWAPPLPTHGGIATFFASPTVFRGVVYLGDEDGRFYAVKESTQTALWSDFLGYVPKTTCYGNGGIVSTATVAVDPLTDKSIVYVDGPDGNLYALDAATGATVWKAQVDVPSSTVNDYFAWGSPLVANGKVYVGISSNCDNPLVPAGLLAVDQETGAQMAVWHTLSGGRLGGSIWSAPAALPDGSVVVTTGNSQGVNQVLWAESVVRLDGSTLTPLDGWQVPQAEQTNDADFGGSPTEFTAVLNGVRTPMVGSCNKNGMYYAFRQADLHDGPVWEFRMSQPSLHGNECIAAAIWDGTQLIEGAGQATSVAGVTYDGAVRSLDPATGTPRWETGLPGAVIGSPTEDGAGVVAAPVFTSSTGAYGVYLLRASDGALLRYITTPGPIFAQPVFANGDLLVAGSQSIGVTAYDVTTPGPALQSAAPASLPIEQTSTVTITGSGFSGVPRVFVSGFVVAARSVHVISPTQLTVSIGVSTIASLGPRDLTVTLPDLSTESCSGCIDVVEPTSTTVLSSTNPSIAGAPVTFTAAVTGSDGGGTITFSIDGSPVPACTNLPLGAGCSLSTLSIRAHVVKASYSGDTTSAPSFALLAGGQVVAALPSPASLTATVVSTSRVDLSWPAVTGATKYSVYRATHSGGPYAFFGSLAGRTGAVTGLAAGTTYYFVVTASNAYGPSAYSSEASAVMPPALAAPAGLTAHAVSSSRIDLSWSAVAGATKYSVYTASSHGGPYTLLRSSVGPAMTLTGLAGGTTYYIVVTAANAYGMSPYSVEASATTR